MRKIGEEKGNWRIHDWSVDNALVERKGVHPPYTHKDANVNQSLKSVKYVRYMRQLLRIFGRFYYILPAQRNIDTPMCTAKNYSRRR